MKIKVVSDDSKKTLTIDGIPVLDFHFDYYEDLIAQGEITRRRQASITKAVRKLFK